MDSNDKGAVAEQAIVLAAMKLRIPVLRPVNEHATCVSLRLTRSRNGQRSCINLADDFTFDGAVAQLARASRWQREGQGFESPQLHSNSPAAPVTVGADACRIAFGYWLDRVAAGQDAVVTRRGRPMIRLTAAAPASAPPTGATTPPAPKPGAATPPILFPLPSAAAGSA
jgi:antitoxin (DNA-binding transcriptional repressor) of toxin-antitoxin stability system